MSFDVVKNNKLVDKLYIFENGTIRKLRNEKYDLVVSLDDEYEACELAAKVNSKKLVGAYLEDSQRIYTKDSSLWFDMGLISRFGKQKADELKAINKKTHPEIMYKILDLKYKKEEPILVLNKKELNYLFGKTKEGLTIVPLSIYNKGRRIKLSIGLARHKKKQDKRETIKKREFEREKRRELRT